MKSIKEENALVRGVALGVAIGAALGVVFGNIAIGVGVGIALGAALGFEWQRKHDAEHKDKKDEQVSPFSVSPTVEFWTDF